MQRILLILLLALSAVLPDAYAQEAKLMDVRIHRGDFHEVHYPQKATEVLNAHFEKLGNFYSYFNRLDSNLKKQKPYADYFKKAPFATYIVDRYQGDTVNLSTYSIKLPLDSVLENALINDVKQYWEYEGWLIPLLFVSDLREVPISVENEQELLFRVRFVWEGLSGDKCVVLQRE